MELQNKEALVTGGASGIGLEAAKLLAAEGASVVIAGRDATRGAKAVAEIEAAVEQAQARFVATDLADLTSVQNLATAAGAIDILVNNAGAFPLAPTLEQDVPTFQTMLDTNVSGPFFLTAALLPAMIAKGAGSIINVTTAAGLTGMAGTAAYGASKAAFDSLTRTWAAEFGHQGIRVNAVAPGYTRTDNAVSEIGDTEIEHAGSTVPLGRLADPREIAQAILFLASPRSSYVTGTTLAADGGLVAAA